MNLLDKAISDIKQRKSNKTQDQTNPKLEGTSLTLNSANQRKLNKMIRQH